MAKKQITGGEIILIVIAVVVAAFIGLALLVRDLLVTATEHPFWSALALLVIAVIVYAIETDYAEIKVDEWTSKDSVISDREIRAFGVILVLMAIATFLAVYIFFGPDLNEGVAPSRRMIFPLALWFVPFGTYILIWKRHRKELYESRSPLPSGSLWGWPQEPEDFNIYEYLGLNRSDIPGGLVTSGQRATEDLRQEAEGKQEKVRALEASYGRAELWEMIWSILGACCLVVWGSAVYDQHLELNPYPAFFLGVICGIGLLACKGGDERKKAKAESLKGEIKNLRSDAEDIVRRKEYLQEVDYFLALAALLGKYGDFFDATELLVTVSNRYARHRKRIMLFVDVIDSKESKAMSTYIGAEIERELLPTSENIRRIQGELRRLESEIAELQKQITDQLTGRERMSAEERRSVAREFADAKYRKKEILERSLHALEVRQKEYERPHSLFKEGIHDRQGDIEALASFRSLSKQQIDHDLGLFVELVCDEKGLNEASEVRLKKEHADEAAAVERDKDRLISEQESELITLRQKVEGLEEEVIAASNARDELATTLQTREQELDKARIQGAELEKELKDANERLDKEICIKRDIIKESANLWESEGSGIAHNRYGVFIATVVTELDRQLERREKPDKSEPTFRLVAREVLHGKGMDPGDERSHEERFFSRDSFIAIAHCNSFRNGELDYAEAVERDGWKAGKGDYLHAVVLAFNEKWKGWFRSWLYDGFYAETLSQVLMGTLGEEIRIMEESGKMGRQEFYDFLRRQPDLFYELVAELDRTPQEKVE